MSQFLEALMLICFGISWPISLAKSLKAKTARSTSLSFILLIMFGYAAGICAKIINHATGYIIWVYIINFLVVSCNLAVYFINRRRDRMAKIATECNHIADRAKPQRNASA